MATENVRLARRWFEEVWNQRRTDTIDERLTDESVCHSESGPLRGSREFKERAHAIFLSAFPDLRMTVEGTVAEGNQVVVRWAATATHLGDGLGFPTSGRAVSFRGDDLGTLRGRQDDRGRGLLEPGRADPVAP
jgi:predicted ester cyclase